MGKLQPVEGKPGSFKMPNGSIIEVTEWFPRFLTVKTPWTGKPPAGSEWLVLDVRPTDEAMVGVVRLIDAERNRVVWEADKRALVARDLRQREITPGMRDAASYLEGVAETMSEFTANAEVSDVLTMAAALERAAGAWAKCYRTAAQTEKVPEMLLRGDLPKIYKLDIYGTERACEFDLVVLERRPVT